MMRFNYMLLSFVLFLLGGTKAAAQSEGYGVISAGEDAGIYHYTLSPQGFSNIELVQGFTFSNELNNSDAFSGGVLIGERYYYILHHKNAQGYQSDGFYYYDLEEKATHQVADYGGVQQGNIACSLFYDYQNDILYGGNGFQGGGNSLVTIDLETGAISTVAQFSVSEQPSWAVNPENYTSSMSALTMTYDGDIYGVGYWGGLYKIDVQTGVASYIGAMKDACPNPSNGQVAFQYQGAADLIYDNDNGKLYLMMYQYPPGLSTYVPDGYGGIGSGYALFEVNTETADVTYIEDTDGHHFIGNSLLFSVAEASAPQAPQNVVANRNNGELVVTLEWDNPSKTYGRGGTLEDLDYVVVQRNGTEVYRLENPEIGGHVSWTDNGITERGNYTYRLSGYNSMGQGDRASVSLFVGPGDPLPITALTVTSSGSNAIISWTAPTEGKYHSWIDTDDLTYDVTRQPGNVPVAIGIEETTFIDETIPLLGTYSYTVVASAGGYNSDAVTSANVNLGPAIEVPATIGFETNDQFSLWTRYDLNGNGTTWSWTTSWPIYRPTAYVSYAYDNMAASDLIISPYIHFEAGKHYKLLFDATFNTRNVPELLNISFGKNTKYDEQENVAEFHITPTADKQFYSLRANLPVAEEEGNYHVGFYYRSYEAPYYGVYLENVRIEEDTDGYIAGKVTNAQNEPIVGALLLINGGQYNALTDENGDYILNYLPAGDYNIDVQAKGYHSMSVSASVAQLQTTTLDVTMDALPTYAVSGTVKDVAGDAIAGATVEISGYESYATTTDQDGKFSVPNVYENNYYALTITKNKYNTLQQSFTVEADKDFGDLVLDDNIKAPRIVTATESADKQTVEVQWAAPANDPAWVRYDDGGATTYVGVEGSGTNGVFGIIDPAPSTVFGAQFFIGATAQVTQHYSVYLRIFGLDENGMPNGDDMLYQNTYVPVVDNEWTTYMLPAPIDAPNGYYIAVSHSTFASIGIDGAGDTDRYPFRSGVNCFTNDYTSGRWFFLEGQANANLHHNFMMRAYAAPFQTDEDVVASTRATHFGFQSDLLQQPTFQLTAEAAPAGLTPAPSSTGQGRLKTVQQRVRYNVYRFKTSDKDNEDAWTLLEQETANTKLTDLQWADLESNAYYYGVKAVYTGDKLSAVTLADSIGNKMSATVTFRLTTNTEENESYGARVFMINGGGRHVYEAVADDDGLVTFENVWKAGYDVTISLDGFISHSQQYVFTGADEFVFDVELKENQIQPYNLIIEDVEGNDYSKNFIWNYPDYIFEGFEEHTDFAINSPGPLGWQYIDGDGGETGGVAGFSWPGMFQPMAFQVFNPSSPQAYNEGGTNIQSYLYGLAPYQGQKMLTDWAAYDVANDDWIISPRLHFQQDFVFRFYAKCIDYQYLENFSVLYSTTDTNPESFITLRDNQTAYSYYQGYTHNVPKEAKYVAIHCISDQKRVFCVDNIEIGLPEAMPTGGYYQAPALNAPRSTFNVQRSMSKAPALDGAYEVYLDGAKIADTDATQYLLENLTDGIHTAGVIASYTSGKTEMSTIDFPVGNATVGIGAAKASMLKVSVDGRLLTIEGDYEQVSVLRPDGVAERINRVGNHVYDLSALPAGVYVINVTTANGQKTLKVTLK
ncbi:MAG: carboxypeptidase regulatory-like domain-containing protein [Prevotella sp.]|nr:carboxypeptidase regulatory-like domain-containing protein [Prevotella sp.]